MLLRLVSDAAPTRVRLELFPTPVCAWRWPEADTHHLGLVAYLNGLRPAADPFRPRRWRSAEDLLPSMEPGVAALAQWTAGRAQEASVEWHAGIEPTLFGRWRMRGWAEASLFGEIAAAVHHAGDRWHWSALYCLDAGRGANPGLTLLFEERGTGLAIAGTTARRTRRLTLAPGELVIFPAWLHHRIEAQRAPGEQLALGFNLHNPALEESRFWPRRGWAARLPWRRDTPPAGVDVTP